MKTEDEGALFSLGKIVVTTGVMETIPTDEALSALIRHSRGDWGDVCDEDRQANEDALVHESRLLSAYNSSRGVKLWIITEHDRSYTTILLSYEY